MSQDWLQDAGDGSIVLRLHVQPNAARTGFAGRHGDAMKLRLAAAPVDGKANAALCAFIADFCAVPKRAVTLLAGETSRTKRLRVEAPGSVALARLRRLEQDD